MKVFLCLISVLLMSSCSNTESNDQLDLYVEQSVDEFGEKISRRGGRFFPIKDALVKQLKKIEDSLASSATPNEIIVAKLKCIDDYKNRYDQKFIYFEEVEPYAVQTKDSIVILFNVQNCVLPNVYLKEGNSANKIDVTQYAPLTISVKNPNWTKGNRSLDMPESGIGLYQMNFNGRDKIFKIEKVITSR